MAENTIITINQLLQLLSPASNDLLVVYDYDTDTVKSITYDNLFNNVTSQIYWVSGSNNFITSTKDVSFATKLQHGLFTSASGPKSHAEGEYTTAIGSYSHTEGTETTSVGIASHAEGSYTTTLGSYSHSEGAYSITRNSYEQAYSVVNSGQFSRYGLYSNTTNATPKILYITGTEEIIVPSGSTAMYKIDLVGRSRYATNKSASYQLTGVTYISSSWASAQLLQNTKTVVYETDATWDVNVGINTTNGNLRVTVTGSADSNINWYANVEMTSVYNNV